VDFFANGTLVGSDTTRAFAFSWVNPAAGKLHAHGGGDRRSRGADDLQPAHHYR
jgi:hypothetical protein